ASPQLRRIHSASITCMAFNLQKVLKALLLSSSQPLAIKDIQAAFTRFHEQAAHFAGAGVEPAEAPDAGTPGGQEAGSAAGDATTAPEGADTSTEAPVSAAPDAAEAVEVPVESPQDPELYSDVPSLITATQIREAMDKIAM